MDDNTRDHWRRHDENGFCFVDTGRIFMTDAGDDRGGGDAVFAARVIIPRFEFQTGEYDWGKKKNYYQQRLLNARLYTAYGVCGE